MVVRNGAAVAAVTRSLIVFLFRRAENRSFPIDKSSWAGKRRAINARSKETMKVECHPIGKQLRW